MPAASAAAPGSGSHWPDLRALIFPRSVALVGLSERTSPEVVDNLTGTGLSVVGVHPRAQAVRGLESFTNIAAIPSRPELAFMLVGHRAIEAAFEEALNAGVRAFVVPGLGNEAGKEGPEIARRIARRAHEAGAAMVGPNCMGVAVPRGASFWIGSLGSTFLGGHVAAVVQSGSIGEALVAHGPRVGYRCVISSGGELVTDVADYCAFFAQDEGTRAVGLFLESVRRPQEFARALGLLADAGKPVVCVKVGRSAGGASAVLAHSGAVVGSDVAFSALLRAYGVIQVDDYPEFVEVLELLGRKRRPKGTRLGGVSNSGGEGALLADHADAVGLPFRPLSDALAARLTATFPNYMAPQNPVDAWAIESVEQVYPGTLKLLVESGEFDILVAQVDQSQYLGAPEVENAVITLQALVDAIEGTHIFPALTSVQACDTPEEVTRVALEHDVAILRGSQAGMRALAAVAGWRPRRPPELDRQSPVDLAGLLRPGSLPEYESGAILERYGIPVARRLRALTPDQAASAAAEIGFPVVVKRDGPAHKSREGGVVLGLLDEASVRAAATRLSGPVLVAAQAAPGVELFCGMSRDPEIGPVLVLGLGGAAAEILPDKQVCAAPIALREARQLIADSRVLSRVVPPAAAGAVARIIVAIGLLAVEHPEVSEMDINPLMVGEHDVVAVDALVVVSGMAFA